MHHPHIFPKNTNNVTRTTLSNGPAEPCVNQMLVLIKNA